MGYIAATVILALLALRGNALPLSALFGGIAAFLASYSRFAGLFNNLHNVAGKWQNNSNSSNFTNMSEEEARAILDVEPNATLDEIKHAYHSLMKKNHPDQGGSKYLAAQLNRAKEVLLSKK